VEENMAKTAAECFSKTYVKLKYVPPVRRRQPLNCAAIHITEFPQLGFPYDTDSIDLVCHVISTEGVGGIILLLQVKAALMWKMGFIDTDGFFVTESHRVDISMPILYKISGPRLAFRLTVKGWAKAISYLPSVASLVGALKDIHGVQRVMAKVVSFHKGFCPEDVKALEFGLKALETEIGNWWRQLVFEADNRNVALHGMDSENFVALMATTSPLGGRFSVTGFA
jgi:hypothetical protein